MAARKNPVQPATTPTAMDILGARMFAYIGEGHSLTQAARKWGTSKQYVSQCVKRLQQRLPRFNWDRGTSSFTLTT